MATWKVISQMTRTLIENCVVNFGGLGGYFTYGLEDVAQAVASPVMYDLRDVPLPIPVEQPDGIGVDLGNPIIADNGGISKLCRSELSCIRHLILVVCSI